MEARIISRLRIPEFVGTYSAHQRVFLAAAPASDARPERVLFRRSGPEVLVVADQPAGAESKRYEPLLQVGEVLQFTVLVDVSVARKQDDRSRGVRRDPVLDRRAADPRAHYDSLAREVIEQWFQERRDRLGFEIVDLHDVRYAPLSFVRPRDRRPIRTASIDVTGLLRVTDAGAFHQVLLHGVGRSKSWGCGLLLVRRIA